VLSFVIRLAAIILLCHSCFFLNGCSSLYTNFASEQRVNHALYRAGSDCDQIPRVYSGVTFNYCYLTGTPREAWQYGVMSFLVFDMLPSAALDTVALPFTGVRQRKINDSQAPEHF